MVILKKQVRFPVVGRRHIPARLQVGGNPFPRGTDLRCIDRKVNADGCRTLWHLVLKCNMADL